MCQLLAGWGGLSAPSGVGWCVSSLRGGVVCQLLAGWGGVSTPSGVGWCVSS